MSKECACEWRSRCQYERRSVGEMGTERGMGSHREALHLFLLASLLGLGLSSLSYDGYPVRYSTEDGEEKERGDAPVGSAGFQPEGCLLLKDNGCAMRGSTSS
jgi:hypothetical protein